MSKLKHHFHFDIYLLKGIYIIPFAGYLLTMVLMLLKYPEASYLPYILLQGIAIPVAGLHLVFLYSSIYDDGATDTLIPYYRKNIVYDLLRYGLLHGCILLLPTSLLVWIKGIEFFNFDGYTPTIVISLLSVDWCCFINNRKVTRNCRFNLCNLYSNRSCDTCWFLTLATSVYIWRSVLWCLVVSKVFLFRNRNNPFCSTVNTNFQMRRNKITDIYCHLKLR